MWPRVVLVVALLWLMAQPEANCYRLTIDAPHEFNWQPSASSLVKKRTKRTTPVVGDLIQAGSETLNNIIDHLMRMVHAENEHFIDVRSWKLVSYLQIGKICLSVLKGRAYERRRDWAREERAYDDRRESVKEELLSAVKDVVETRVKQVWVISPLDSLLRNGATLNIPNVFLESTPFTTSVNFLPLTLQV